MIFIQPQPVLSCFNGHSQAPPSLPFRFAVQLQNSHSKTVPCRLCPLWQLRLLVFLGNRTPSSSCHIQLSPPFESANRSRETGHTQTDNGRQRLTSTDSLPEHIGNLEQYRTWLPSFSRISFIVDFSHTLHFCQNPPTKLLMQHLSCLV